MHYGEEDEKRLHKVENIAINETEGAAIELHCPHSTIDTNVIWRKHQRLLDENHFDEHQKDRFSISSLKILHINGIKEYDTGEYDCAVGPYIHGIFKIHVISPNNTKYDQSHLYRKYDIFFLIWFCSVFCITITILVLKCCVYLKFMKALDIQKTSYKKFNKHVDKYIETNLTELLENHRGIVGSNKNENDEDYDYDDIIEDKVDKKIKKLTKK